MQNAILRYAPEYWNTNYVTFNNVILLNEYSNEYRQIMSEVISSAGQNSNLPIKSIKRNQNVHDLGQCILREQLLVSANPGLTYYRVRRYITIKKQYLKTALEYNIDPRRCGKSNLHFQKSISCASDDIILVVQVITSQPDGNVIPNSSSEYFIDYIVEIN